MAEQLGFRLPSRVARGRDSFFVAPSNAMALGLIEGWHNWPSGKLLVTGPTGSGKTHLAHVWAALSDARIIEAMSLNTEEVPSLAVGPLVVEDVPQIAGQSAQEEALFHLHNLILSEGHPLLLTGTGPVAGWGISLPDLRSRLQGTASAALEPPDDTLLQALLVKLLADRQLVTKPNLIPYLLGRMDRSFSAAIDLIERLDRASLARKRPLTRALAAEVLDNPPSGT